MHQYVEDDFYFAYLFIFCWVATIFVVLFTAFTVWWNRRIQTTVSFEKIPLPGLGPFDGHGVSCTCKNTCEKHEKQPESMRMGSVFLNVPRSKIPKTQIALYSVDQGGRLQGYLGVATRLNNWLVVPYHVIASEEILAALIMRSTESDAIKFETSKFTVIDGDLAAIQLSEATFSQLGLVKAAIIGIEGEMMVTLTSSSKDPEMSFGTLVNDVYVFGGVVYRGSTKGGFSGAPYMVAKNIAGIHLGGGQTNYGVSATYIMSLLQKPEETAEWLQRVRRKRGPLKYQRSKYAPDEAIVFVGGRYHNVDIHLLENDIEEARSELVPMELSQKSSKKVGQQNPERIVEVNLSESFPPHYRDVAEPVFETVTDAVNEIQAKNLEMAEQCSADQAEAYLKRHAELMGQLDEKVMLLQALQDSLSTRYREIEKMLTMIPKGDQGREALVKENEILKKELTEVKHAKTSVNVDVSSVKAVPKIVREAKAKDIRAGILDKAVASGYAVEELMQALVERGLVVKVVAEAAKGVETIAVKEDPLKTGSLTKASTSSQK